MIQDEYTMLQELLSKEMCTAQHQEGGEMGTKDTERMQQLTNDCQIQRQIEQTKNPHMYHTRPGKRRSGYRKYNASTAKYATLRHTKAKQTTTELKHVPHNTMKAAKWVLQIQPECDTQHADSAAVERLPIKNYTQCTAHSQEGG